MLLSASNDPHLVLLLRLLFLPDVTSAGSCFDVVAPHAHTDASLSPARGAFLFV
jgi:hypothetical protein